LIYAVWTRQNILISGGAGVGKTTLLNALAAYIPDDQRIVLIEDTTELQIDKPNRPRFEANHAGVTVASLLKASLRHRPSRLIVGEVRGAEAFDLLQALNSGHQGSLSTIHATSAPRALTRLARCAMQASSSLSHDVIWPDILESIQVVVHLDRVGPLRKVTAILDVAEGVAA
jgi:pilus assembly protein CpaF